MCWPTRCVQAYGLPTSFDPWVPNGAPNKPRGAACVPSLPSKSGQTPQLSGLLFLHLQNKKVKAHSMSNTLFKWREQGIMILKHTHIYILVKGSYHAWEICTMHVDWNQEWTEGFPEEGIRVWIKGGGEPRSEETGRGWGELRTGHSEAKVESWVMTNDTIQGGNGRGFQNLVMLSGLGIPKVTSELWSDGEKPNQAGISISRHSFPFPVLTEKLKFSFVFIPFRYLGSWLYFLSLFVANCIFHRRMPPIYSFHSTHSTYNVTDACPTESRVRISFSQICMGACDCSPSKVEAEVRLGTSWAVQKRDAAST